MVNPTRFTRPVDHTAIAALAERILVASIAGVEDLPLKPSDAVGRVNRSFTLAEAFLAECAMRRRYNVQEPA